MIWQREDHKVFSGVLRRAETRSGITGRDSDSIGDRFVKMLCVQRRAVVMVSCSFPLMADKRSRLRSSNWAAMNDMAAAGVLADIRSSFRANSKSKNAVASVKAMFSKSPFSTCATAVDFPQAGFPRNQRISFVSPKAHFLYSGLSRTGIGCIVSVVFRHKVDFSLTRLKDSY